MARFEFYTTFYLTCIFRPLEKFFHAITNNCAQF